MALTNREKQARWRERMRERAPIIADLLKRTRSNIREWARLIALYESGQSQFFVDRVNRTDEQISSLRRLIAENGALVRQFDPNDDMADGDVELGDIAPAVPQELWTGRAVSYALNTERRAVQLRLFEADSAAATEAAMTPGRLAGRVGKENWSITPIAGDRLKVHADIEDIVEALAQGAEIRSDVHDICLFIRQNRRIAADQLPRQLRELLSELDDRYPPATYGDAAETILRLVGPP